MEDKHFLKSRTVWAGLILLGYGVATAFGADLSQYTEVILTIAGGLGIVGLRGVLGKQK